MKHHTRSVKAVPLHTRNWGSHDVQVETILLLSLNQGCRGMTNIKTSTYLLLLQIWWVRTTRATDWRPLARDPPTPVHAALLGCQWLIFDILIISFLLGCQWLTKACALFKRRHILVQIENRGCVGETVFHVCFLQGLRLFDKNILCQHHHSSSKAPRSTSTWPRGCSSTSLFSSTTSTYLTSERIYA